MAEAYLGLGGNLGDRAALLREAMRRIGDTPAVAVTAASSFYETPPWGETEQPPFLNAALAVETALSPHDLLAICLAIEAAMGRTRGRRWGPRLIDIDLLHYAGARATDDRLTLPHPRLRERAFVLVPLAEIAPHLALDGDTVASALARLDASGVRRWSRAG